MNEEELAREFLPRKPWVGLLIASLPIVGTAVMFLGYMGMFGLGFMGRQATGEQQQFAIDGCAQGQGVVAHRLQQMGLPATWQPTISPDAANADQPGPNSTTTLSMTLPGDPAIAARVPQTLTSPATLKVKIGDDVILTNEDLTSASVRLDLFMIPSTLLTVTDEASRRYRVAANKDMMATVSVFINDEKISEHRADHPMQPNEFEILLRDSDNDARRMQQVTDWSIVLSGAQPRCPVTISPIEAAQPPS